MSRRLLLNNGDVTYKGPVTYETVTVKNSEPKPSDSDYSVADDKPVYFLGCHGAPHIGEPNPDGTFRYVIEQVSAIDNDVKSIRTFTLDHQLNSDEDNLYWDDVTNCYMVEVTDDSGLIVVSETSIRKKIQLKSYEGGTLYSIVSTDGIPNDITIDIPTRETKFMPYTAQIEGVDVTLGAVGTHTVDPNGVVYLEWFEFQDNNTDEYEYKIVITPPDKSFEKEKKFTMDDIKNKKIKLPYYGEGTMYSLQRTAIDGKIVKGHICVSAPLVYNFKLAYKILEGFNPLLKNSDSRIIRTDQPGYVLEVRGNNHLDLSGYTNTATIKLLGDRIKNGQYQYYLNITSVDGVKKTSKFKLNDLLAWYSSNDPELNYTQDQMSTVTWDQLYWDDNNRQYMIQKRNQYLYADTAYGDIEFLPYYNQYSNFTEGWYWEFLVPFGTNYNVNYSSAPRVNTNYAISAFTYASGEATRPMIFPACSPCNYEGSDSLVINATPNTTLDTLDVMLSKNPLHAIVYYKAENDDYDLIPAGLKRQIPINITDHQANAGAHCTVSNHDINAYIKIAIPVSYIDMDVPEPTYDLGAPKEFTGSTYVNTNVKLFDTAKDFTILLDYHHKNSDGVYLVDNGVILHCRYESTTTQYRRCGLAVENGVAPTAYISGGTDHNSNGYLLGTDNGALSVYKTHEINGVGDKYYRHRIVIVYKDGVINRVLQVNESGDILFEYPLQTNIPPFVSHTRTLYLGCQTSTSGSRSKYFKGTIVECKIWEGTALTNGQIMKVIGDGPYPKTNYELTNYKIQSHDTLIRTGVAILEKMRDFSLLISFDASPNVNNKLNKYAYVASYGHNDGYKYLCVRYNRDNDAYELVSRKELMSNTVWNVLADDTPLPIHNNRCSIIVNFKDTKISEVYDCGGENLVKLPIKDDLMRWYTTTYVLTLGYLQGADDTDTNRDPHYVWYGDIYNCKVWLDKNLTKYEIEYLMKYELK